MHPEALKYAQARNEQALALIQECVANNDYKPYNLKGEQEIGLKDLY
tara:strand:- start:243 stop:383 length:141 start_codon:yes stop_codon:yes gene_type:complete